MLDTKKIFLIIVIFMGALLASHTGQSKTTKLTSKEELGKKLFFDANLSTPPGQACASCHGPSAGWTGPDLVINEKGTVYPGAAHGRFGNRKPPSSGYAGDSPPLYRDEDGAFIGGMFWDGRATGEKLGDPLAEQAMGPFLNPLEQNNPDKKSVILKVRDSDYVDLFQKVWGSGSLDWEKDVDGTYERIARSIAAYERSNEVNPFNSKFDEFWKKAKSARLDIEEIDESNASKFQKFGLSEEELKGLVLFNTKGNCSNCHLLSSENGKPPIFTDFTYDNLGIPKNPDNPFYSMPDKWNPDGEDWLDTGLGGFLEKTKNYASYAKQNYGKQKVPTLRNVDLRPDKDFIKAYAHNGYFRSLKDIVHFYNTRDRKDLKWPPPEITENVNTAELGDLGLTDEEEDFIVIFMKALSDR